MPHLSVFSSLPQARQKLGIDINPQITSLVHTTGPGGFESIKVGLKDPQRPDWGFLPQAVAVEGMDHIVLEDGGFLCCEGRMLKPQFTGGELLGFEATGYGITALADGWYDNTSLVAVDSIVFLRDILLRCTGGLLALNPDPNLAISSGIPHTPNDNYHKMGHDLVDMLAKEAAGTSGPENAAPFDFDVWENRYATWTPRLAPPRVQDAPAGTHGPDYVVPFSRTEVDWDPDYTQLCSDVTVFYTDTTSGPPPVANTYTASNPAVTQRYGVVRRMALEGGSIDPTRAKAIANTYLALYSQPRTSVVIRRSGGRGLERALGGEQSPQLVRHGEWVQVGDQEPVYILSTSYNWTTLALEVQGSVYPPGYWYNLAQLEWSVRMMQGNMNVTTGAPLVAGALP